MTQPTLGALVLYTTAGGSQLPAIVVHTGSSGTCNLQVFTDESLPNILHISDVEQTVTPAAGKYHFATDAANQAATVNTTKPKSAAAPEATAVKGEK